MMRHPAFSMISRYSWRDSRRSPGRDGRAQVALELRHRLRVLERDRLFEPARTRRAQRVVEQHGRARRQELAALDEDLSVGPRPSRAAATSSAARRISPASSSRRPSLPKRAALERGEPATRGFARAVESVLGRPRSLQPMARVAAQRRAYRAAQKAAPPVRRGACLRGPTAQCRVPASAVWNAAPPRQRHA
jgi:hypothetical protein